ncbi:hypothetical protein AKO1_001221, partial [Acrasis kona]
LLDELDNQENEHFFFESLCEYNPDSRIIAAHQILIMFINDACIELVNQDEFNEWMTKLLHIFKKFLKVLSKYRADFKLIIPLLKPIQVLLEPHLAKWISMIQSKFDGYLESSLKFEKYEFVENSKNGTSLIDLFTFLEQPIQMLQKMYIPSIHPFFRAYAQCLSGMVQQYAHHMCNVPKS